MGLVYLLLLVVLIGAGIYGGLYYYREQQNKLINDLTKKKEAMLAVPVADTLYTLKHTNLTGQTKRIYESWRVTWQTMTRFQLPEIESLLAKAQQLANNTRLIRSKESTDKAAKLIEESKKSVDKIYVELQKILDSEQENQGRLEKAQDKFNELRKELLTHTYLLGPAAETLEKRLSYLELDFTQFNTLSSEGDHVKACEVLNHIEKEADEIRLIAIKLPEFYKKIDELYLEQVDDLKNGYRKLIDEKYVLTDADIPGQIQKIQQTIDSAREYLTATNIEEAQTLMDKIARLIDQAYSSMEKEIKARAYVEGNRSLLKEHLDHLRTANDYVKNEIDRVAQNYILSDGELEKANQFEQQLKEEEKQFDYFARLISVDQACYSRVAAYYDLLIEKIETIGQEQEAMVDQLARLHQDEKAIESNLDDYELSLRNMKRSLEKHHLPGLDQAYLDLFFATSQKIESLSADLTRVQIDMKEISQKNHTLAKHVEDLAKRTRAIIEHAQLTEYMVQYANRYRQTYKEINLAIQQALEVFQHQYNYDRSLAIIEQALEKVEPGAGKFVRRQYQEEKAHGF